MSWLMTRLYAVPPPPRSPTCCVRLALPKCTSAFLPLRFINPCYFGTDIDSKDKLIACRMSIDDIRKTLDADTLGYLSLEHLQQIAQVTTGCGFCMGCFTGEYPIEVPEETPCDKFSQKLCNN